MTELAAGNTGGQTVVTDRDLLVDELIGKVVGTLSHGSNKYTNTLLWLKALNVFSDLDNFGIETECNFSAVWWKVVAYWVLDDLQELLLRVRRANRKTVEKLNHETGESFESTWNTDGWRDLNQDTLCCMDVDLELASLVDRRVEKCKKTLTKGLAVNGRDRLIAYRPGG